MLCVPVQTFNENVPKHELGEGNAGLVVVRNGTVQVRLQQERFRQCVVCGLATACWLG